MYRLRSKAAPAWALVSLVVSAPIVASAPVYESQVVHTFPHDSHAFTEGLFYLDGFLYESTGLSGASSIRKVELSTGRVLQKRDIAAPVFGEGIVNWKDSLVALTYKDHAGTVHNLKTFEPLRGFSYPGEGWGITQDGKRLIMSDGTAELRFLNPESLAELGRVTVRREGSPLIFVNELEWIQGLVFANVWMTDSIVCIDPASGDVVAWIDLTSLRGQLKPASGDPAPAELNGIAYDAATDRLFVTGKNWPNLFEITLRKGNERVTARQLVKALTESRAHPAGH
jgi:glutamine cyclotransferase